MIALVLSINVLLLPVALSNLQIIFTTTDPCLEAGVALNCEHQGERDTKIVRFAGFNPVPFKMIPIFFICCWWPLRCQEPFIPSKTGIVSPSSCPIIHLD